MIAVRKALLGLVGWFGLVLARDWWDGTIGSQHDLALVLAVAAALAAGLLIPVAMRLPRAAWLGTWAGLYLLGRWIEGLASGRPWLAAGQAFDLALGVGLLLLGAGLAFHLHRSLHALLSTVERVALASAGQPLATITQASDDIRRELARSRRYHYPLSVVLIELDRDSVQTDLHQAVVQMQRSITVRYVLGSLVQFVQEQLRRTDLLLDPQAEGRLVLLTPDTDQNKAALLAARLQAVAAERFNVRVNYGLATFPTDALNFDELLSLARERVTPGDLPAPPPPVIERPPADSAAPAAEPSASQPAGHPHE